MSKWLPAYPHIDNSITIRQLLNHTSGIFDWVKHPQSPYQRSFDAGYYAKASSPEEVVKTLVNEPYFPPGRGFHYSTTNYALLKMIVEKACGSTVAKQIRERFLEPLHLNHTFVLDAETAIPHSMRIAHAWWDADGDGTLEDIASRPETWIATRSPAMIYSTAEELARWSQAVFSGELLDRASLEQVLAFYRPTPSAPGEPFSTGYGLGTQELRLGGLVMWGHLGWHYGYTSSLLYIPRHSACIAVLINDNNMMLINMAAIILLLVMEFHLETIPFLLILFSAILLLSTFILWPPSYVIRHLKRREAGAAVGTEGKRRKAGTARGVAVFAETAIALTILLYFYYSMNPERPLSWVGGNAVSRSFIVFSITSAISAFSLIFFTFLAWKDKLWAIPWRVHYTLVTLAGLIAAYFLFSQFLYAYQMPLLPIMIGMVAANSLLRLLLS